MRKSNLKLLIITNRIYQTSCFDVDFMAEIEDYISNHIQRTQGDCCPKPRYSIFGRVFLEKLHIECWICMHEWDILPPNLKELPINDKGFIDSSLPKPLLTKYR